MPTKSAILGEVPLFSSLDADERELLAAQLDECDFSAGQRIFARGDPGGAIFVVSRGAVEISIEATTGERIVFETAKPGDFFGELSLLDGDPRSADAIALEDTKTLRIDRNDLSLLFKQHPDAAMDVLTVMGKRLREADRFLGQRSVSSPNAEVEGRATGLQRVADSLARFSGNISFLNLHFVWFGVWVVINLGKVPSIKPFDPYPFGLLTMVVSLEAIFLSCFVLISQNRQASKDKIRSDVEYAANIRAGLEVTQLHVKLDHFYEQAMGRLSTLEGKPPPGKVAS